MTNRHRNSLLLRRFRSGGELSKDELAELYLLLQKEIRETDAWQTRLVIYSILLLILVLLTAFL